MGAGRGGLAAGRGGRAARPPLLQRRVQRVPDPDVQGQPGAARRARPRHHAVAPGKSQTFSVEGDNAELRHYLARLGRRSRCFSRCLWALARAVALFVYAWNRRQTFKREFPKLPAHVCDFVADLI